MYSNKKFLHSLPVIALATFISTNALAQYEPNDNYNSFVVSFLSSKFSTPVCFGGECHEVITGPAVVYARQIMPNLALGLAGSQLQSSGKATSIKSTNISAFAQAIAGMGPSVDIGASVSILNNTTDLCTAIPNTCASVSDSGTDVGVFGKVFLTESRAASLTLSYNSIYFQKSPNESIIGLSLVTILAKRHRLAFSVDRVRDTSGNDISGGFGFGYSYVVHY